MLIRLYKQRYSTGRTISAVVLFAWLSLLFQTCVMAANLTAAPCDGMAMQAQAADMSDHGSHDAGMADESCCPPMVCAGMSNDEALTLVPPETPRMDSSAAVAVLYEPIVLPDRANALRAKAYQSANYPPPHPTIRFCVLRI